ncbi:uncharacterized protein VP01_13279g1, partial [Puccinia sorghi]
SRRFGEVILPKISSAVWTKLLCTEQKRLKRKCLYSPKYLEDVGDFQAEHLTSEAMGLKDLLTEMVLKTYAKNGGTGNNNALVVAQAGPSTSTSPKVQMSI